MSAEELRQVETFADIPDEKLERVAALGDIRAVAKGEHVVQDGDPAEHMFVILEGALQVLLSTGGSYTVFDTITKGRVTGVLPFSRMTHFRARVVAATPALYFRVHRDRFQEMLSIAPELGVRLVGIMSDRVREQVRSEQQNEKMLALGKLSAGLTHELNNPAAAIRSATASLKNVLVRLPVLVSCLAARGLTEAQVRAANDVRQTALARGLAEPASALERSEREDALSDWLEDRGVKDAYKRAATLSEAGLETEHLEAMTATIPDDAVPDLLAWIEASFAADRLLSEIAAASGRISDLVASVKSYSHMDRAITKEPTDVRRGISSTLVMLGHELKAKSIRVSRADAADLPLVPANEGELNQVWTNLIDNAIDAMNQGGELRIETAREGDFAVVRVIDDGGGIPEEVQPRIFDPFFTTKSVGEGTGLGLDIVQRIVRQHGGQVTVSSRPGRTEFSVRLPISAA